MEIVKPKDAAVNNIKMLIYGSSSSGKTKFVTNFNETDGEGVLLIDLEKEADDFPAILKNSKRALASLKMMELNISDLVEFGISE